MKRGKYTLNPLSRIVGHTRALAAFAFALALSGIMHKVLCWNGNVFWKGLSVWLHSLPSPGVWLGTTRALLQGSPMPHQPSAVKIWLCPKLQTFGSSVKGL